MRLLLRSIPIVFVIPVLLMAQTALTGTWEGQTPNRASIVLELAVKGADLTGTMHVGAEKSPIENGKISKNTFTFSVAMGGGVEAFTGERAGDEIRIWMDDRGPAAAITLKRMK
jgi:hypothetical protein